MNDKVLRSLLVVAVTLAMSRTGVRGVEALPPHALARIGDHHFYHSPVVTCAALSPDGHLIASAAFSLSNDKEGDIYGRTIILWDAASGERLREMRVPHTGTCLLAFSPDGKRLAADYRTSDEASGVAVYEVETGKLLRRLEQLKSWAISLQFSADGKQLQVSEWRGPVRVWDSATGKQVRLCKPPPDEADGADKKQLSALMGLLSPDGRVIAWVMGYRHEVQGSSIWLASGLRVVDAATSGLLFRKNVKKPLLSLQVGFSADSKRLAAYSRNKLLVWDTVIGREMAPLRVPTTDIAYQASDEEEGTELHLMHEFALSPDGRNAAIGDWGTHLRLWDLENGKPTRNISPGFARWGYYRLCNFSSNGRFLLARTETTLRRFDTTAEKDNAEPSHRAPVTPRFSSDGGTLFTSCEEKRCRWDVSGTTPILVKHEARNIWSMNWLAQSADNGSFLDVAKKCVRVRETATGRVLRELKWDHCPDAGLFSPDASRLLLWYDSRAIDDKSRMKVGLFNVKSGEATKTFTPSALVGTPVFTPDGRGIAWADNNNAVHLYDVVVAKEVRLFRSSRSLASPMCDDAHLLFSPDGEQLIVTTYVYGKGNGESFCSLPTRVFQVSSGREIVRFYTNPKDKSKAGMLSCMTCSPDGRLLAVADTRTIRLLEIASGKLRVEFAEHRDGVHGLTFAPDGKRLASGGEDNVVFLWDVTGARTSAVKTPHESDLASWWNDLATEDGERVGVAIASLLCEPDASVAFLCERLHPAEPLGPEHLAKRIADLDSDVFETREAASRELIRLVERAEPALRLALEGRPTLEAKFRIEDILSKLEPSPPPPETLRAFRAIEVLEHVGTSAARRCLEALSKGPTDERQAREAKKALGRLLQRR